MQKKLLEIYEILGITQEHLTANRLSFHDQPELSELKVLDIDFEGKPFILVSEAATAWVQMKEAAAGEQVFLMPFSGFRSWAHQKNLIEKNLKNGRKLEDILTHIAIPGFSEHHTGRAIDIHANGNPVLDESFELTREFKWLTENAKSYGFQLSYPRNNSSGIIYEPWHWFYSGEGKRQT